MFALSANQGRARGGLTPRVSSSSRISGQKPNLLFHNQIFSSPSLAPASARGPHARPSSRRQASDKSVGGVPQKFSHENGEGEGQHRLHLPKLLGAAGRKTFQPTESSQCLSDHCQAIKLPEVNHHMPKIKTPPGASSDKNSVEKTKRSKYLKKKILGSSDANVLPNRPMIVPRRVPNAPNCDKNANKVDTKSSRFSQQAAPAVSPRPLSPVARASVLKHRALALNRAKALSAGQVHVRPKIDKEVLCKMQSRCRQPLEKYETPTSRRTGSGTSIRSVYSQMQLERGLHPSNIPHGGPMIMESRSVNRLILKPEVPRGLQVVRRKSKFMQNQNLQDIFSIQGKSQQQNPNFQFNRLHRSIRGDGHFEYASASFERPGPKWQQRHYQHHCNGHLSSENCIDKNKSRQVPRRFQSELKK